MYESGSQEAIFAKRWNFVPMWYRPRSGLIDLFQIFATPFLMVQFHVLNKPDPTEMFHDHPWNFLSFVVRGGYTERVMKDPYKPSEVEFKTHKRFSIHTMNHNEAHNITLCKPKTVTLFFTGPWKRDGFRFYMNGKDLDVSKFSPLKSDTKNLMKIR